MDYKDYYTAIAGISGTLWVVSLAGYGFIAARDKPSRQSLELTISGAALVSSWYFVAMVCALLRLAEFPFGHELLTLSRLEQAMLLATYAALAVSILLFSGLSSHFFATLLKSMKRIVVSPTELDFRVQEIIPNRIAWFIAWSNALACPLLFILQLQKPGLIPATFCLLATSIGCVAAFFGIPAAAFLLPALTTIELGPAFRQDAVDDEIS